ncbi:hypothetical protein [Gymnodinialimonas ceratoperidinii]|uniref:Uncharacterized protein n=1 Tax=Gymnodinialimonas ceratoperidinii TaxID=2856823 RepID=A0A8F6TY88_9RHOB|nr:hypothetical protein [Gymnodinialimonas ceratoperidinii]QXT39901.1 hypothetical protein KYE46_01165 [Gymnodinialimonas ceratoperidinii]
MKRFAFIAALAAVAAAPAVAQSTSTAFAIAHFNESADNASDIVIFNGNENTTRVSTAGNSALAETFNILNRSADTPSELNGTNGAVVVSGEATYGSDIFDRLAAESREDN